MNWFRVLYLDDVYFREHMEEKDRKNSLCGASERLMNHKDAARVLKRPVHFQRGMAYILKENLYKRFSVYIDDILIFGRTPEEHDKNYFIITECLEEYNLKIEKEKSRFKL